MKPAHQAELDALRRHYFRMRKTYGQLVGTLYPAVVYAELTFTRNEFVRLGGSPDLVPEVPRPLANGAAPPLPPLPACGRCPGDGMLCPTTCGFLAGKTVSAWSMGAATGGE